MSDLALVHADDCPKCTGQYPKLGHTFVVRRVQGGGK